MMNLRTIGVLLTLLYIGTSCTQKRTSTRRITVDTASVFNEDILEYYQMTLDSAAFYIQKLDTIADISTNQQNFLKSRAWYKRAEPMLIAYDYENYLSLNAPNLLRVDIEDQTDIKKLNPQGYQVLEECLFGEESPEPLVLHRILEYMKARIPYIRKNHIIYTQRDRHHLKMLRDAIINIATKGITGFDSPMLSNSLVEVKDSYETIKHIIELYSEAFTDQELVSNWLKEIEISQDILMDQNFDSFDRYNFIKNHINKQLELIVKTQEDWGIQLSGSRQLNPTATNIFAKDFYNMKMFSPQGSPEISEELVALGELLFSDESLSSNGKISCASCHIKELAFTDGLKIAKGLNGKKLQRNSPTMKYAVYQKSFFYDGRADGLEDQIVNVVNDENEFHMDLEKLENSVKENPTYAPAFDNIYGGEINNRNIRHAIATYIRSLAPFDSKFDRNMQNLEASMTDTEIEGFNLFMGKAACATCHFPPVFNGNLPPKYMITEFENLGVPKNNDFENPVLDDDPGLYYPFEVEEKRHFFKTPTLRNVALTGPFMHNGVYEILNEVMEFYDVGGGQGLGLEVPYQTLPPDSLKLTELEKKSIIAFLLTLTDKSLEPQLKLLENTQSK